MSFLANSITYPDVKAPAKQHHLAHPKYRRDIDGLRAIAVLSVVAFHAFPGKIAGGFVGVDVFFVISGFLISTIIFENLENQGFSYTEFFIGALCASCRR
jgi:peptidoglycan/LPS O-acetylase OafA/YrhL